MNTHTKNLIKFARNIFDLVVFAESFLYHKKSTKQKLLVVRIDGLGDFILFLPSLRLYKKAFPNHSVTLVLSEINKDFVGRVPEVDEYIIFDRKRFSFNPFYRRSFLLGIAKGCYDVAIYPIFSRQSVGDLIIAIAHARRRIGFEGDDHSINERARIKNNRRYTQLIAVSSDASEIEKNTAFVKALGAPVKHQLLPHIDVAAHDGQCADTLLKESGIEDQKFCIVFPGAGAFYRSWPLDCYAEIVAFLSRREIIPVICGSASEKYMAETIMRIAGGKGIDLTGKMDIFVLAALLQKSEFYIGSETGIVHLAAAVGAPTICLIGGGHFGRFFPYGDPAMNRVVYDKDMRCMKDNWACAKHLGEGEIAPCIEGIQVKNVESEIDNLQGYLKIK